MHHKDILDAKYGIMYIVSGQLWRGTEWKHSLLQVVVRLLYD
jgi:hypothetical protein